MADYRPTIGLEIHAELKTRTKMFCDSKNDPEEKRPNANICPVCMAHPGTLPVINRAAVHHVLRMGAAIDGTLADYSEFDRKNYFYPDIPKGYQISQYKYPLVSGGELAGVKVTRIHLEEDTARSSHEGIEGSLVDFNRAGVPLMELVTEPVIHDAETASRFAKELQLLLRTLGASDANMEKGEMRVEANISISATEKFGTKVEVKNLNSFKSVERAIAYEIKRHAEVLDRGEKIIQETRGWDENLGKTFSQRLKEEANDYRYFPDPDLPSLKLSDISEFSKEKLAASLPELPWVRRERFASVYGIAPEAVEMFVSESAFAAYFEEIVAKIDNDPKLAKLASNYLTSDYMSLIKGDMAVLALVSTQDFAELIKMAGEGEVSSRGAKDILAIMVAEKKGGPRAIANERGLLQSSDESALKTIVEKVLAAHPKPVEEYKAGKDASLQFLVGQVMKESRGSANPGISAVLLKKTIRGDQ